MNLTTALLIYMGIMMIPVILLWWWDNEK